MSGYEVMRGVYLAHAFYFKRRARAAPPGPDDFAAYLKIPGDLRYTQVQIDPRTRSQRAIGEPRTHECGADKGNLPRRAGGHAPD